MTEPMITPFQVDAETAVRALLERAGRQINDRELLHGTIPFLLGKAVTITRLTAGDLVCWLDDRVLDFKDRRQDGHFEREDYASEREFLAAFIHNLERAVIE